METEIIRERLQEYIRFADDKKIAAIYTLVEYEIVEHLDLWEDKDFLNEMESRVDDYESGKEEAISWEEVQQHLRNRNNK